MQPTDTAQEELSMMTPYHLNALLQEEREWELSRRLALLGTRVRACCRPSRWAGLVSRIRRQQSCTQGAC